MSNPQLLSPNDASSNASKPVPTKRSSFLAGLWKKSKHEPEFPPREWGLDAHDPDVQAAAKTLPATPAIDLPMPLTPNQQTTVDNNNTTSGTNRTPTPDPAPTSTTLAQRIRDLLSSEPKFDLAPPPPLSPDGAPVAPPPPNNVDVALAKLLASASVMNGAIEQGKKSVWDALDRMRAPEGKENSTSSGTAKKDIKGKGKALPEVDIREPVTSDDDDDDDRDSTLMFYSPIVPSANSHIELAALETVSVDKDGKIVSVIRDEPPHVIEEGRETTQKGLFSRAKTLLPFGRRKSHADAVAVPETARKDEPSKSEEPVTEPAKEDEAEGALQRGGSVLSTIKKKMQDHMERRKVWVPSATQLSFQASWWGYRIYLPPPIVAILDDKSVEASKRAAMLATALKWLLGKVPVSMFPPQMRPGVAMAKKLVPYAGYLGAAIAWSWTTIKGYDKGRGIILSATWPLPWALIPSTWTEEIPARAPDESNTGAPVTASSAPSTAVHTSSTAV